MAFWYPALIILGLNDIHFAQKCRLHKFSQIYYTISSIQQLFITVSFIGWGNFQTCLPDARFGRKPGIVTGRGMFS